MYNTHSERNAIHFLPTRQGLQNTLTAPVLRGKPPPKACPGYDTKQSDGEVPVMLRLWEMLSTPSLPLHTGPIGPGMITPDRTLSIG